MLIHITSEGKRCTVQAAEGTCVADLAAVAVVEQNPLMEGRQMVMMFAPKKK